MSADKNATDATRWPTARLRRVLAGLVPVACPPEAVELGLVDDIVEHALGSIAALPRFLRTGLAAGALAYDAAAIAWLPGRARPSTRLPHPLAERWFLLWLHSSLLPQRQLLTGLKQLLCLAHFEMPVIQARLGYTPDAWIERVTRKRLMTYSEEIRRHEDALLARDPLPAGGFVRRTGQNGQADKNDKKKEAG